MPPEATLDDAAARMKDLDVGLLPVCDQNRLVGMLTDRDITCPRQRRASIPPLPRWRDVMMRGDLVLRGRRCVGRQPEDEGPADSTFARDESRQEARRHRLAGRLGGGNRKRAARRQRARGCLRSESPESLSQIPRNRKRPTDIACGFAISIGCLRRGLEVSHEFGPHLVPLFLVWWCRIADGCQVAISHAEFAARMRLPALGGDSKRFTQQRLGCRTPRQMIPSG